MQSGLAASGSAAYAAASLSFHTTIEDGTWDQWLATQPNAHVLQLSGWRKLKQRFGWGGVSLAGARADSAGTPAAHDSAAVGLVNGCQLLFKRTAGLTLAYAPRGPITDWGNRFQTELLLHAIHLEARRHGAAVLKIEPDLPDTADNRALLRSYGFSPSSQTVQPPSTITLDINGTEDAILSRMKSKWRYNVRLAERKGVQVRALARDELLLFHALMQVTGERDGFGIHSAEYFAAAYELLTPQHAVFLVAEYAGEPLAAIVVAAVGSTACYLWGASSDRERSRMPNHALQWEGMRWARSRGAASYDFWGIPDDIGKLAVALHGGDGSGTPTEELPIDIEALPQGELWGVYRFKQGFGGSVVRTAGAWDMALDTIGYRVYQLGLGAREAAGAAQSFYHTFSRITHGEVRNGAQDHEPAFTAPQASVRLVDTAEEWRTVLDSLPDPHVLQSWEWGDVKGQTGWYARRYLLTGDAGTAAFQLLWRQPVAGVPLRMAYVPKGPLLEWGNLDLLDSALEAIEHEARLLKCIYVKIDPDVRDDTTPGHLLLHALARRGWQYSADQIQFKNTAYSNLAASEEALLAQMKQKWRYNVRLAEKRGVIIRQGNEGDFAAFYSLYDETGARDGFLIRPYDYYAAAWRTFLRAQGQPGNPAGGVLLLAEHADDKAPVAGIFLFRYGRRAWYFYGASSERHRRDMPNYLLQWEALRWSLGQGCTVYDWWGAPTKPDDPDDAMQGVWQFKQGFGAELQSHVGAWDFAVSPTLYTLYQETMPAVLDWMRSHR
ncbi:MAG: peptidoglycan bridge formation glycyltransferase FemA/FemB family protein [Caldilineaceae bacterium]